MCHFHARQMRPAGMFMRPAGTAAVDHEIDDKSPFTMNSMAHASFHIYIPFP
jgi:hypothetical protein